MDIWEKYNLDKNKFLICNELPKKASHFLYYLERNDFNKLYINEKDKLKLIVTKPSYIVPVLLFLKKYRPHPELLPRNLKHDYPDDDMSSEDIYKAMQLMLKPMNSFEEFKERLLLATKELPNKLEKWEQTRYGEELVFVNKKEDCSSTINMYGEVTPWSQKHNLTSYEDAILFNKEKNIFEYWVLPERTNDTPDRCNWRLVIKFYEEKYLYEYLLNKEIYAVK